MTTDPQAPEIAALAESLDDEILRVKGWIAGYIAIAPKDSVVPVLRGALKLIARLASTPLPIAPQETMLEVFDQELMAAGATVFCGRLRTGKCTAQDMGVIRAVERTVSRLTALGQSQSPATVERELVEALETLRVRWKVYRNSTTAPGFSDMERMGFGGRAGGILEAIEMIGKALATASQPGDI